HCKRARPRHCHPARRAANATHVPACSLPQYRQMTAPLEGIKVLELARVLAGPWAGQLLADLGADVIKIERPGSGDDTRGWGPPFVEGAAGKHLDSAYYHAINRGKRSVTADFRDEKDREFVRKLATEADVVIENYKVG